MNELTVSFGLYSPAAIAHVKRVSWEKFAAWLTRSPPIVADKAACGWYIPAEFAPAYRDSDNFVARSALTFDFDRVDWRVWDDVQKMWSGLAFAMYTTFSHTNEKPRFRVVIPLSRPAGYDEFQAVARKLAVDVGIENVARESFVPAQMMYAPACRAGGDHLQHLNPGDFLDVDSVLAEYADWTDRTSWPHRKDGDHTRDRSVTQISPNEKAGIVGDFCRAFTISQAIERFGLPYSRVR